MAKEELVMPVANKLVVFDKHDVAELMASHGIWQAGTSAVNNSYKALCNLVDLRKLEKGNGFFRLPGCKSEYGVHAQILTKTLTSILKVYKDSLIHREHLLAPVGLRADSLILVVRGKEAKCLWVEVKHLENENYYQMKVNALKSWDARPYLSKLFGYHIPAYTLITNTDLNVEEL